MKVGGMKEEGFLGRRGAWKKVYLANKLRHQSSPLSPLGGVRRGVEGG
jgi:hypothetical protein